MQVIPTALPCLPGSLPLGDKALFVIPGGTRHQPCLEGLGLGESKSENRSMCLTVISLFWNTVQCLLPQDRCPKRKKPLEFQTLCNSPCGVCEARAFTSSTKRTASMLNVLPLLRGCMCPHTLPVILTQIYPPLAHIKRYGFANHESAIHKHIHNISIAFPLPQAFQNLLNQVANWFMGQT